MGVLLLIRPGRLYMGTPLNLQSATLKSGFRDERTTLRRVSSKASQGTRLRPTEKSFGRHQKKVFLPSLGY